MIFHKVRFKNFLSYGNSFQEFVLDDRPLTIINGKNGSGKSTLITAIIFCLYNRNDRDPPVNKAQLVNSITKKGCLVEVEFSNGPDEYLIRRGIKPNVFEIHKNSTLLDQSESRDYQAILENEILKIDYKTFMQIVVLGSATYVQFMRLTTPQRRQIIEDMLNLEVFSIMNEELKRRLALTNDKFMKSNAALQSVQDRISLMVKLSRNKDTKHIDIMKQEINEWQTESESITVPIVDIKQTEEERSNLASLRYKMEDAQKHKTFYVENDICSQCHQAITPEFKKNKIEELGSFIKKAQIEFDEHDKSFKLLSTLVNEKVNAEGKIRELNYKIKMHLHSIASMEKEQLKVNRNEALQLKAELDGVGVELKKIKCEIDLLQMAAKLLKDDGIKSKIILQYIPMINSLINKYLLDMDFLCQFELNENFEECIKSRFRDEFKLGNFSMGEKLRINLAIVFAWREIAKRRNSVNTNILFFDETLESSLDEEGIDTFLRIISNLAKDQNVFVITHSKQTLDQSYPMFKAEKIKGFSRIVAQQE